MRIATTARALLLSGLGLLAPGCGGYGGGNYDSNYGPAAPQLLIRGDLSGGAETTVVAPNAKGASLFDFHNDGNVTFAVTAEASWVGAITGVKIHRGNVGLNGPAEIDLLGGASVTFDPLTRTATGSLNVGAALASEIIVTPAYFYVNVTTTDAPAGYVRGQLAAATPLQFHTTMRGSEQTTVVSATSRGEATLAIGVDRAVHYVIAMATPGVGQFTMAHIHAGARGTDGPIIFDLAIESATPNLSENTTTNDLVMPVDVLCRLLEDLAGFYVNVHTGPAPLGIARGQLTSGAVGLWATLSGAQEIPVIAPNARGGVTLELTSFTTGRAVYAVPAGIGAVNGAHVHVGTPFVSGPSVIDLRAGADFATGTDTAEGAITLDQTLFARLLANPTAFYADLHTSAGAFERGQLGTDPATFRATLLGTNETTVVTPSASGSMKLVVTGVHAASFDVSMTNPTATSLVGAHVHEGAAGVDGAIRIDLMNATGMTTTSTHMTGDVTFTGRTFASLLGAPDLFYGNVHTAAAPNGVARGQFVRVTDSSPPSGLTYTSPVTYVTASPITPNLPSSNGGAVASYSVVPALPAGLSLNGTSGIISGTPTATAAAASYVVTASNTAGSTTATVNITVNVAAPANLVYATPVTYVVGTTISPNTPTSSGGAIATYAVSPALPAGLSLNTSTGVISGTPTAAAGTANYTVTGTNVTNSTQATVTITVQATLTAPSGLSYSTPVTYGTGSAISANTPTVGGGPVASYSVSPSLPAGLALDTTTGVISGTPTTITSAANYTVTATNGAGFTTATVNIAIVLGAPSDLSYSNTPGIGYVTPASFTTMQPTVSGGAVASYSIAPALPAGITLNTTTGNIAGTPTATSGYTAYTVTATNAAGSTTATIYIVVY